MPLDREALRALVARALDEQAVAHRRPSRLGAHDQELARLDRRRRDLTEAIEAAERRLADAARTLEVLDRPLRHRGHRAEISAARADIETLPGHIDAMHRELDALPSAIAAAQKDRDPLARSNEVAQPESAERLLEADAHLRGGQIAQCPDHHLVTILGPIPHDEADRARWITAAGRLDQHRAAWATPDARPLGARPPANQPEYAFTYQAAQRTIAELSLSPELRRPHLGRQGPTLGR